jgi:hypothetical protein
MKAYFKAIFPLILVTIMTFIMAGCTFNKSNNNMNNSVPLGENNTVNPPQGNSVGSDKDSHGCIGSAGYTWCEAKQKCIRIWEENCYDPSQDQLQFLLANKFGLNMSDVNININQSSDSSIRGTYTVNNEKSNFLAAKKNGVWTIVYDGKSQPDCPLIKQYNFSNAMLQGIC